TVGPSGETATRALSRRREAHPIQECVKSLASGFAELSCFSHRVVPLRGSARAPRQRFTLKQAAPLSECVSPHNQYDNHSQDRRPISARRKSRCPQSQNGLFVQRASVGIPAIPLSKQDRIPRRRTERVQENNVNQVIALVVVYFSWGPGQVTKVVRTSIAK